MKNYQMGNVVAVEARPAEVQVLDQERQVYVNAVLEGYEDVYVTVEKHLHHQRRRRAAAGRGYDFRVGQLAYVRGPGYMGSGPVTEIERGLSSENHRSGRTAVRQDQHCGRDRPSGGGGDGGRRLYVKTHKPQTGRCGTTGGLSDGAGGTSRSICWTPSRWGTRCLTKERSTGGSLGTITDIQVSGGTYEGKLNDGTVAMLPAEGCYNILLTIEGEALIEGNGSVMLNRIYSLGGQLQPELQYQVCGFCGDHRGPPGPRRRPVREP